MDQPVLIAGNDTGRLAELAGELGAAGYSNRTATGVADAMTLAARGEFACLIIAGRLRDARANDLLARVRGDATTQRIAVLMIGSDGDEIERLVALELGADEYLPPGFSMRELSLRLRALLRRCQTAPPAPAARERIGLIEIDRNEHRAWVDGQPCDLSGAEFRLLVALATPAGIVHSRAWLRDVLDAGDRSAGDRWIDARVARLRDRLGPAGSQVETVRGVGYRLYTFAAENSTESEAVRTTAQ